MKNEAENFKITKFKKEGLALLKGHWLIPVLITFLGFLATGLVFTLLFPTSACLELIRSFLNNQQFDFTDFPISQCWTLLVFTYVFVPVLEMAQLYVYTLLKKNSENLKFVHFIKGFSFWRKALENFWWKFLWLCIWMILGLLCGMVIVFVLSRIFLMKDLEMKILVKIAPFIFYFCMIIPFLIKDYQYLLSDFLIAEKPKTKAAKALNLSGHLTKGYKWKLFCLDLSFLGWDLLCILLPFGSFWLKPYKTAAKYSAYKFLQKINKES